MRRLRLTSRLTVTSLVVVVTLLSITGTVLAGPPLPLVFPLPSRRPITSIFDHDPRSGAIVACNGMRTSDDPDDPHDSRRPSGLPAPAFTDYAEERDVRWATQPGWLWYDNHAGTDYRCPVGTSVVAAAAGTAYAWGDGLRVDHGDGWETRYLHLSQRLVGEGVAVVPGQLIGLSGTAYTGAHLHFEVRRDGVPMDPYGWEAGVLWAGGDPVPVGYRDSAQNTHGPFALIDDAIYARWLRDAALLGSPMSNVMQVGPCTEQAFERGRVYRCGERTEVALQSFYLLPIVTQDTSIEVYGDPTRINLTFYDERGHVLDSINHQLTSGRWEAEVKVLLWDYLGDGRAFSGSAVVSADGPVDVGVWTGDVSYSAFPTLPLTARKALHVNSLVRAQNAEGHDVAVTVKYGGCSVERWLRPFAASNMVSPSCPPDGWSGVAEVSTHNGAAMAAMGR